MSRRRGFLEALSRLREEKRSILCVGLDPALPRQRGRNVIRPPAGGLDESDARLGFCLDIVRSVEDYAVAAKPNQQYIFGFTVGQHRRLTREIGKRGMVSILDYKLNDIGDTVRSAMFWIKECGYDAVTLNPLPGNLAEAVRSAHEGRYLGVIVLTLMSNPEAERYLKGATVDSEPLYMAIARGVRESGADGCVVGATGHVSASDIRSIRAAVGDDRVLLVPGIGAQRGDPEKAIRWGGENVLINVGRAIIYSDSPRERAAEYSRMFNEIRRGLGC